MKGPSYTVRNLLEKARESALLAVEVYNKPKVVFRSGAYIVLMMIAWTALIHAIFAKRKTNYHIKMPNKRYETIDGERKTLDLKNSVAKFFPNETDPIRKNIEFFIGIRNKVEHRSYPKLDNEIFGECQALLINFEEILLKEFGPKNIISENLIFALQFSKFDQKYIVKQEAKHDNSQIFKYLKDYRKKLDENILINQQYSFRAYLIPKIGKNAKDSDMAIEFIRYDAKNPEEMKKYEHLVAFVKDREIPVSNLGKYKPKGVKLEVEKRSGKKFSLFMHTNCCRLFRIRPEKGDQNPIQCNPNYCNYDKLHKDYVYTEEWINFLVEKLKDQSIYDSLKKRKTD